VPADQTTLQLNGWDVKISSPTKIFFPRLEFTKLDLVEFYVHLAEPLMEAICGRPILMQRFPDGAGGKSFFQKRVPKGAPEWLQTTIVSTPNGTTSRALVAADIAHVAWAVNLGCLGFHVWPHLAADPEHSDELRIDLDPQPGVKFDAVREAAFEVKSVLDELGINAGVKTSGSKGLHIYARLERCWNSYQVRAGAVALARELERRRPDLLTAAWWKEERGERVFVDFNQNAPHKTVFGAWSARSRVGGQVSTPLMWSEVNSILPDNLTVNTVPGRFDATGDPWRELSVDPQSLVPLLKMSERDMEAGLMDAPWPPVYPKQPNEPPRVAPSRAKSPESDDHGM
jgi:DNA ligase D